MTKVGWYKPKWTTRAHAFIEGQGFSECRRVDWSEAQDFPDEAGEKCRHCLRRLRDKDIDVATPVVEVGLCEECPMFHDGGQGAGLNDGHCMHPESDGWLIDGVRPSDCPLLEKPLLIKAK